jgi:probable phosphoglycerate mutase
VAQTGNRGIDAAAQDVEYVLHAGLAVGGKSPQVGAADHDGAGTEREGCDDVTAVDAIAAGQDGTAVVASHGAAIRCWVAARAGNISPAFARTHALGNTGSVIVEQIDDLSWHALCWNAEALGGAELDTPW